MESAVVRVASFSDFDKPSAVSWSSHGNIIAIALPPRQETSARVVILEPDAPHVRTALPVFHSLNLYPYRRNTISSRFPLSPQTMQSSS